MRFGIGKDFSTSVKNEFRQTLKTKKKQESFVGARYTSRFARVCQNGEIMPLLSLLVTQRLHNGCRSRLARRDHCRQHTEDQPHRESHNDAKSRKVELQLEPTEN